ncbi:SMR domain-containing protein [Sesamum angolense]|uniref:SMR domain-containing protein n=1 Tax=Sesamum angolense TaxID=2727404 RepID=A0AAE1TAX9_9LAMI|nr:SMR domain-containing protein [Sesamum angolense]
MKQSKKKKRSRASSKGNAENHGKIADEKEQGILKNLLEGFASVSVEEAASTYREAASDLSKAAEIPTTSAVLEEQSATCSSSSRNYDAGSSSSSNASEVFGVANNFLQDGFKQKSKHKLKKVVASAGTVSTVLGKDYVRSIPKKVSSKMKGFREENWSKEEAEQFLCSMLGDDCELSLAVVSDVLCQCDYNLDKDAPHLHWSIIVLSKLCYSPQNSFFRFLFLLICLFHEIIFHDRVTAEFSSKGVGQRERSLFQCSYIGHDVLLFQALDVLLELSASSKEQVSGHCESSSSRGDSQYLFESNYTLIDRISDSTSHSSDIELQDNIWFTGNLSRNVSKTIKTGESNHPTETENLESELPQKVLESLFNMPTPKTAEHEPNTMNWRNVVKKMTSLGHRFEPGDNEQGHPIQAKGDEYQVLQRSRKTALEFNEILLSEVIVNLRRRFAAGYNSIYKWGEGICCISFSAGFCDVLSFIWNVLSSRITYQSSQRTTVNSVPFFKVVPTLSALFLLFLVPFVFFLFKLEVRGCNWGGYKIKWLERHEKASQDIFTARNESIENVITIDLHGQHIKQAMKLLKLHLLFGAYVRSVRSFRVITGCGSHGVGKSKLKNSVINLLQKEGIAWSEENRGTLFIRLDGQRDFSFLDSGSDSD